MKYKMNLLSAVNKGNISEAAGGLYSFKSLSDHGALTPTLASPLPRAGLLTRMLTGTERPQVSAAAPSILPELIVILVAPRSSTGRKRSHRP